MDDALKIIVDMFQINLAWPALIMALIALLKEQFGVNGRLILLIDALLCLGLSTAAYQPDVTRIIAGTVVYVVMTSGTWATAKQIAHKVGVPKT